MKVNLIVNRFPTATETFLFNLVVGLEKEGIDVTVIAGSRENNADLYKDRIKNWSGKILYLPFESRIHTLLSVLKLFKKIKVFIKLSKEIGVKKSFRNVITLNAILKNKPDIVHYSFSGLAVNSLPVLDLIKKEAKVFISCRGSAEKVKPLVDPDRANKLKEVLSIVDKVHCVSHDMQLTMMNYGMNSENSFVNFPSIELEEFTYQVRKNKKSNTQFTITSTGRLYYQKGYIFSIIAIRNLLDLGYDVNYQIIGSGPDYDYLKHVIADLKVQDKVHLLGRMSKAEVIATLQSSDIFLLPSIYEGIANAALEAMALGVPIVSTDAGGMNEIIEERVNGRIVKRYDLEGIVEALRETFEDYDKALEMAEKARETVVSKNDLEYQIDKFIDEYSKSLVNA